MYLESPAPGHKSPLPCLPKIESPMLSNLPYNSWSFRFSIYFMNAWDGKQSRWHLTLFTFFFIFQELSFQILAPMIYSPFTPCSPSLLKKEGFFSFFFFCICASAWWRRNRPWPPSNNPWTSTCTRLISSAWASYRLPPLPPRHPHRWMTGLLKPTRPNPLILLHHSCPADWSSHPYLPNHSQGSWLDSMFAPQLGLARQLDFSCTDDAVLLVLTILSFDLVQPNILVYKSNHLCLLSYFSLTDFLFIM